MDEYNHFTHFINGTCKIKVRNIRNIRASCFHDVCLINFLVHQRWRAKFAPGKSEPKPWPRKRRVWRQSWSPCPRSPTMPRGSWCTSARSCWRKRGMMETRPYRLYHLCERSLWNRSEELLSRVIAKKNTLFHQFVNGQKVGRCGRSIDPKAAIVSESRSIWLIL